MRVALLFVVSSLISLMQATEPGQLKLENIRKLEASAPSGVIPFTAKQYK